MNNQISQTSIQHGFKNMNNSSTLQSKIILASKSIRKRCRQPRKARNPIQAITNSVSLNNSWIEVDGQLEHESHIPSSQTSIQWDSSSEEESTPRVVKKNKIVKYKIEKLKTPTKQTSIDLDSMHSKSPIISQGYSRKNLLSDLAIQSTTINENNNQLSTNNKKNMLSQLDCKSPVLKSRKPILNNSASILERHPIKQRNLFSTNENHLHNPTTYLAINCDNNNKDMSLARKLPVFPKISAKKLNETEVNEYNTETVIPTFKEKNMSYIDTINESFISNCGKSSYSLIESSNSETLNCTIEDIESQEVENNIMFHQSSPEISSMSPVFKNHKTSSYKKENEKNRGSDWVKSLLEKTPEKMTNATTLDLTYMHSPCSKLKKNGLADHFQKILQSWQSSLNMWHHQKNNCFRSPVSSIHDSPTSSKIIRRTRTLIRNPSKLSQKEQNLRRKLTNEKSSILTPFDLIKKEPMSGDIPDGALSKTVKSSLDISPASSISLSNRSMEPKLKQKHLSLKVVKVLKPLCSSSYYIEGKEEVSLFDLKLSGSSSISSSGKIFKDLLNSGAEEQHKKYKVVLGKLNEMHSSNTPVEGDEVKIFAPWQTLNSGRTNMSTIFASYYTLQSSGKEMPFEKDKNKAIIPLATWVCTCTEAGLFMPSCSTGSLVMNQNVQERRQLGIKDQTKPKLELIHQNQDENSYKRSQQSRIWTVMEAVEYCKGKPGAQVSVTARILRIFHMKKNEDDGFDYTILGQDPSGAFFIVEIPDRPLVSTLKSLLQDGIGTTQTLTSLTIVQRLTENHKKGLFSIVHTLQDSYTLNVLQDERLRYLLPYDASPQVFCYQFSVTLGQTKAVLVTKTEGICFSTGEFTFGKQILLNPSQSRGMMKVVMFYYVHPYLYATNPQSLESRSKNKEKLDRIFVQESRNFPPWMSCDGTILNSVQINDIWRHEEGCFCVDEFSSFEKIEENLKISFADAVCLIPELNSQSKERDIVTLHGFIESVNEADSLRWMECPYCISSKLEEKNNQIYCLNCRSPNVVAKNMFSLKVILKTSADLTVVVDLYQKTIEKLLKFCEKSPCESYLSQSLVGSRLEPLICCFINRKEENQRVFKEMPY